MRSDLGQSGAVRGHAQKGDVSQEENVMKTAVRSVHSTIWYLAVVALLIAALMFAFVRPAAQVGSGSAVETKVFSFAMWCLEMQLYPAVRCDERRSGDVKAYERYRATAEQYAEQRVLQEKRDQELKERLNRDPVGGTH